MNFGTYGCIPLPPICEWQSTPSRGRYPIKGKPTNAGNSISWRAYLNEVGNGNWHIKRRLQASCLWPVWIQQIQTRSQGWGNCWCPRDVYIRIPFANVRHESTITLVVRGTIIHIGVGYQRCSFYYGGQMLEPRQAGWVTRTIPHAFCMSGNII